jgi:Ca2+-binding RTX toxin-like protein
MYDWTGDPNPKSNLGLIDLVGDSQHVTDKIRTEGYYAYRLLVRALMGAKDNLKVTKTGFVGSTVLVLRDPSALWVLVKNGNGLVTVNIAAVPGYGGTATLYEYSQFVKDEIVGTVPVVGGQFSFTAGDSSLMLAKIPSTLTCGGKNPTLVGTDGDDALTGTAGVDVILGLKGDDTIEGLAGNDVICAGDGADTVYGGDGNDKVFGEVGQDILNGGGGKDTLAGADGNDAMSGDAGYDALDGGLGTDSCAGGGGTGDTADPSCETVTSVP